MESKKALITKLKSLLSLLTEFENAKEEKNAAIEALNSPEINTTYLKQFDDENMEQFIQTKIGKKPVAPHGLIVLALPVFLVQKMQFDTANANYKKSRPLAEAAYREEYREQREALRKQDEIESAERLAAAQKRLSEAETHLKCVTEKLEENDTVNSTLKKRETIEKIVLYLEESRADTLKEAINLFYEETRKDEEAQKADEHRKKMIELEEEKVRAAQAAEEYAEMQYREAQQAAMFAQAAADSAREIADKTDYTY